MKCGQPKWPYRLALKGEVDGTNDEEITHPVVPLEGLPERDECEGRKDDQGYDLLQYLELCQSEHAVPDSIRWNLKAVLQQCDQPTDYNGKNQRTLRVLQMAVPRDGHEQVRERQQQDGSKDWVASKLYHCFP